MDNLTVHRLARHQFWEVLNVAECIELVKELVAGQHGAFKGLVLSRGDDLFNSTNKDAAEEGIRCQAGLFRMLGEVDVTLKCDVHAAGMEEPASGRADSGISDDVLMAVVVEVELDICEPVLYLPFLDDIGREEVGCNVLKGKDNVLIEGQVSFGQFVQKGVHSRMRRL